MNHYSPALKTFRTMCLAMVELVDHLLEGQTPEGMPDTLETHDTICLHDELMNLAVMGNPGLRYCRRCGTTVQPTSKE